jgi:hypothetical protein
MAADDTLGAEAPAHVQGPRRLWQFRRTHITACAEASSRGRGMPARRLTTILPEMTLAEAIETTHIHRGAGETGAYTVFVTTQPCGASRHAIVRLFAESWRRSRALSRPAVAYWWVWLSG